MNYLKKLVEKFSSTIKKTLRKPIQTKDPKRLSDVYIT